MRKIFVLFYLLFLTLHVLPQETDSSDTGLLWEISGNGLKQKSYIFGTIHIIPKKDFFFYDSWKECFDSCEELITETAIDLSFSEQMRIMKEYVFFPQKHTIQDYITHDEFVRYKAFLKDSLKISKKKTESYIKMKPFFVLSAILADIIGRNFVIYEKYFTRIAKKQHKELFYLESIYFQLDLVDTIDIQKQIEYFIYTVGDNRENAMKQYNDLVQKYQKQDLYELADQDEFADSAYNEAFLINRNKAWIPLIEKEINEKSCFIAVGSAHLPYEYGIINLLRKQGYILKPIKGYNK